MKLDLLTGVLERKLDPEDQRHFSRYFDWLLPLPVEADREAADRAKEKQMEFMSYPEQVGYDRGKAVGTLAGKLSSLETALEVKFAAPGVALMPQLRAIEDPARLDAVLRAALTADTLDDLRKAAGL